MPWNEDHGQSALEGVWRHLANGGSDQPALLVTIGFRRYVDAVRRERHRVYNMRTGISTYREPDVSLDREMVDPTGRTDFDFETVDALDAFERALAKLSPRHRAWVLELIGWQKYREDGGKLADLSMAEGHSISAIAVRIGNRRKLLTEWVEEWAA